MSFIWVKIFNDLLLLSYFSFPSFPYLKFDLFDYQGEEFNQVNCHTNENNCYKNVPSFLPILIIPKEVSEVHQRVEIKGHHNLVED